jgi:hypothetical protein
MIPKEASTLPPSPQSASHAGSINFRSFTAVQINQY